MSHEHIKDRIDEDNWTMPDWMEAHFLHLFHGYSKRDVERHLNCDVSIWVNAPLALMCVSHKAIVGVLNHLNQTGMIPKPRFRKGDPVLAENTRKDPPEMEPAKVYRVETIWGDDAYTHVYRVRLDRRSDAGNPIDLHVDQNQITTRNE